MAALRAADRAARGVEKDIPASQVDNRRYARGRAYDPDRFAGEGVSDAEASPEDFSETPALPEENKE